MRDESLLPKIIAGVILAIVLIGISLLDKKPAVITAFQTPRSFPLQNTLNHASQAIQETVIPLVHKQQPQPSGKDYEFTVTDVVFTHTDGKVRFHCIITNIGPNIVTFNNGSFVFVDSAGVSYSLPAGSVDSTLPPGADTTVDVGVGVPEDRTLTVKIGSTEGAIVDGITQ